MYKTFNFKTSILLINFMLANQKDNWKIFWNLIQDIYYPIIFHRKKNFLV